MTHGTRRIGVGVVVAGIVVAALAAWRVAGSRERGTAGTLVSEALVLAARSAREPDGIAPAVQSIAPVRVVDGDPGGSDCGGTITLSFLGDSFYLPPGADVSIGFHASPQEAAQFTEQVSVRFDTGAATKPALGPASPTSQASNGPGPGSRTLRKPRPPRRRLRWRSC